MYQHLVLVALVTREVVVILTQIMQAQLQEVFLQIYVQYILGFIETQLQINCFFKQEEQEPVVAVKKEGLI